MVQSRVAGPPLIGLAAEAAGLPAALGIVCAACALGARGAPLLLASRAAPAPPAHRASETFLDQTEVRHG